MLYSGAVRAREIQLNKGCLSMGRAEAREAIWSGPGLPREERALVRWVEAWEVPQILTRRVQSSTVLEEASSLPTLRDRRIGMLGQVFIRSGTRHGTKQCLMGQWPLTTLKCSNSSLWRLIGICLRPPFEMSRCSTMQAVMGRTLWLPPVLTTS